MKLSQSELLKILAGTECQSCEKEKLSGCMFCDECWNKLTPELRNKMHNALRELSSALKEGIWLLESKLEQKDSNPLKNRSSRGTLQSP